MTTYAIIVTFILGMVTSLIILYSYLSYNDGKALKAIEANEKRRHDAWRRQVLAELEDDDMQQAVDLVSEKLGGTILDYKQVN